MEKHHQNFPPHSSVCVTTFTMPVHLHGTYFAPFLLLTRRCYDAETSAILLLLERDFVSIHRITEHLGSGQFGTVSKGLWQSPAGAMEVAVKTLKSGSPEEDKVKFLQEAAINGQFRHPNIVQLMGVVTVGEPVNLAIIILTA